MKAQAAGKEKRLLARALPWGPSAAARCWLAHQPGLGVVAQPSTRCEASRKATEEPEAPDPFSQSSLLYLTQR